MQKILVRVHTAEAVAHVDEEVSGALKKFTVSGKEIRKLNCYEPLQYLEHLKFLASHAWNNDFKDVTHIDYDTDIQKLAETDGFSAFDSKNTGLSMFHYGTQNM